MARIRTIKPEFWKSEDIARLSRNARLTFIGLWSYVDDNGVGRDNEKLIAAELYPLEDDPCEALAIVHRDLDELSRECRVVRYTVSGCRFLYVVNWKRHQKIDRPNKERYPLPEEADTALTCDNPDPREGVARVSRDSRETPSPGAVELGNRGTGEGDSMGTREQTRPPRTGRAELPPPKCADHLNDPDPPPCGRCADARRHRTDAERAATDRAAERRSADARGRAEASAEAVAACRECGPDGYLPNGRVCFHDPATFAVAEAGAAAVRAAIRSRAP
jgi:hypothetical protein